MKITIVPFETIDGADKTNFYNIIKRSQEDLSQLYPSLEEILLNVKVHTAYSSFLSSKDSCTIGPEDRQIIITIPVYAENNPERAYELLALKLKAVKSGKFNQ